MPIEPLWSNDCALAGLPRRSAQLLRACQQLYREGYIILYDKNEVAILFDRVSPGTFVDSYCHILNASVRNTLSSRAVGGPGLPSLLHTAQADARSDVVQLSRGAKRFVRLYGVLMRIRKFRVYIPRYYDQKALFMRRRCLRDLLNGKQLTCVLWPEHLRDLAPLMLLSRAAESSDALQTTST